MKNVILTLMAVMGIAALNSCNNGSNTSKQNGDTLSGTVNISGAFALYPLAVKWGDEFKKLHPGVKFNITAGGAGKGVADALAKMVDLGMVSREVKQEEIDKGAWYVAVSKDAVVPTINANNPYVNDILKRGLTNQEFTDLWITGKIKTWGQLLNNGSKDEINVYTRSDAGGAAETWAAYLGKKKQEDLKGTAVFGDPGLAEAVGKDKFGVGYNNIGYAYDISTKKTQEGITIIPIDLNGDGKIDSTENFYGNIDVIDAAIASNKYPSPPARNLYFLSNGTPKNPAVIAFLKWVLTDGQQYVGASGFIKLPNDKLQEQIEKIK